MLKILHISNDYYQSSIYPALQNALINQNTESYFCIPMQGNSIARVDVDNEYIIDMPCFTKKDRVFYYHKQRKIYNAFRDVYNKVKPDILHAHFWFSAGYVCLKAKREFGIPYIVAIRNTDINFFYKYILHLRKTGTDILLHAEQIVFISPVYRDKLLKHMLPSKYYEQLVAKTLVIPNGIDDFWLENDIDENKSNKKATIRIICVGSIEHNKNNKTAILACKLLIKQGYDVQYTMVGRIADQKYFEACIKESFVTYLPPKCKEDLVELYKAQDILIMPSIHETFGLVYAEAMSQGLPVIYTRGQGFDGQFAEGEVGYSVDCHDPQEIAEVIKLTYKNYEQISNNAIKDSKKFNWQSISKSYITLYNMILDKSY